MTVCIYRASMETHSCTLDNVGVFLTIEHCRHKCIWIFLLNKIKVAYQSLCGDACLPIGNQILEICQTFQTDL